MLCSQFHLRKLVFNAMYKCTSVKVEDEEGREQEIGNY